MSVPVVVEIPVISIGHPTATRQGRIRLWSKDFSFDFEEIDDRTAPVVFSSQGEEEHYRFHEDQGWLCRVGMRPDDNHRYRWFYPTWDDKPGEFSASSMHSYVPQDRWKALDRIWDRVILKDPKNTPRLHAIDLDEQMVQRQLEERRHYGDSFKIVGDGLYRLSTEPFFMMRDDGYIVGSHGSKGWKGQASCPWKLYSCVETDRLVRMSHALDIRSEHRNSLDRFDVKSHAYFTPTLMEPRMGLLCYWFWITLLVHRTGLSWQSKMRFDVALSHEVDGGLEAVERIASAARRGVIDDSTFELAESIFQRSSSGAFSQAIANDRVTATAVSVLKEEWENRPIDVEFDSPRDLRPE